MFLENPINLFRLATLVQSDTAPKQQKPLPTYLFGHTPDNEWSTISKGARLYLQGEASELFLCGGGPYVSPQHPDRPCAYSGGFAWKKILTKRGVPSSKISLIDRPELSHTATEAERLVLLAKESGWSDVYIVTAPFHMLRAFAITVSQTLRLYPHLRVWCRSGSPLRWSSGGASAQGVVGKTRLGDFMQIEWNRISTTYGNEYDIVPSSEILKYLENRGG